MYVAGLDWSMTCPAICIYNTRTSLEFKNCQFFFLTTDRKLCGTHAPNVHGFLMSKTWDTQEERFDFISEWGITVLNKYKVKEVCLEGYSMGSKGKIFNIAENIGLLKHKIWKNKINIITPAPTAVKKDFTGKGNANKDLMFESSINLGFSELPELLNKKPSDNPISDIVDSFAMVRYYKNNTQ